MKVAVVANTAWYLHNFRGNLIEALLRAGHDVIAVSGNDGYQGRLGQHGSRWVAVPFTSDGAHPLTELRTVRALRAVLRREGVEAVLTYTPKGTIYTGLALWGLRVRLIATVSGLGRAFIVRSWLTLLVRRLYRLALRHADPVFFQNEDDRRYFIEHGIVASGRTKRVPGSGVDLVRFAPGAVAPAMAADPREVRFLLVARLLWEKGVGEFVAAARRVRASRAHLRFWLLGPTSASASRGVPESTLQAWIDEGVVEYLGATDDVRPFLAAADCVVLPSYREGVPRALLEAAAMARPVVTADSVGCRECVEDGVTGFIASNRDADDLAQRLLTVAQMTVEERERMGLQGRMKMEEQFSEQIVLNAYVDALSTVRRA